MVTCKIMKITAFSKFEKFFKILETTWENFELPILEKQKFCSDHFVSLCVIDIMSGTVTVLSQKCHIIIYRVNEYTEIYSWLSQKWQTSICSFLCLNDQKLLHLVIRIMNGNSMFWFPVGMISKIPVCDVGGYITINFTNWAK